MVRGVQGRVGSTQGPGQYRLGTVWLIRWHVLLPRENLHLVIEVQPVLAYSMLTACKQSSIGARWSVARAGVLRVGAARHFEKLSEIGQSARDERKEGARTK